MIEISDMDLLRMSYCAVTTRMGLVDKGFPQTFKRLESTGYVVAKDGGYQLTTEGIAYLALNKHKIDPPKKKKKPKKADWEDRYDDDEDDDF